MILLQFDSKSKLPRYRQIFDHIKLLIEQDSLKAGDKLPATRTLAERLGVHRTTVCRAYDELWALGYIESKSGSYSYVRKRERHITDIQKEEACNVDWHVMQAERCADILKSKNISDTAEDCQMIDFSKLAPDTSSYPKQWYKQCVSKVLSDEEEEVMGYASPYGYMPLRKTICYLMQKHSIRVNPEEILITNGAQNALDLLFRLLLNPGDKIIVEDPTYSALIPLLQLYEAEIIAVPLTGEGMNLELLEKELEQGDVKLIYTMPNFQNPTGITTSQEHREKLLELSEAFQVPVIEDGFEEEMKYFGKCILPIKTMDAKGMVIYIGTLSKILFPGLRIGWVAASKQLINYLAQLKKVSELSGNQVSQAAIHQFFKKGYFELHTAKMHRMYRKRMQVTLKAVSDFIPAWVRFTRPMGGYTLWFSIPNHDSEEQLMEQLKREGVKVSPGSMFQLGQAAEVNFRLSISCIGEEEIVKGMEIIGNVLKRQCDGKSN